jgi:hypothetical protein
MSSDTQIQPAPSWNLADPPTVSDYQFLDSPPWSSAPAAFPVKISYPTESSFPTESGFPTRVNFPRPLPQPQLIRLRPEIRQLANDGQTSPLISGWSTIETLDTARNVLTDPSVVRRSKSLDASGPSDADGYLQVVPPVNATPFPLRTPLQEEFPAGDSRGVKSLETVVAPYNATRPSSEAAQDGTEKKVKEPVVDHSDYTFARKPSLGLSQNSSILTAEDSMVRNYIDTKPTCTLNLVCYRSGASGCKLHQVRVAKSSRFVDDDTFQAAVAKDVNLITTDELFFRALRHGYRKTMCGWWRRAFFLKSLRGLRLLSVRLLRVRVLN